MTRDEILKSMLDGVNPMLSDEQLKSISSVMKAFSDKQLQKMEEAGVRIWPFIKGMPPEYQIQSLHDLGAPAEYNFQYRVIRISPASLEKGVISDFLRHEFAHAWDDVKTGGNGKSLRKLKGDAFINEVNRRAKEVTPFQSQMATKLPPKKKLTMQEMLDKYKSVLPEKSKSFANPHTAEKHNSKDVMEFYAEGYSVYHGYTQTSQARMMWLAADLFDYLEYESKYYGLATLNRDQLKKVLDDNEKGWRNY